MALALLAFGNHFRARWLYFVFKIQTLPFFDSSFNWLPTYDT